MSFKDISYLSFGGPFVQQSGTNCAILVEGIMIDFELKKVLLPPPQGILQTYPILKKISSRIFKEMFALCAPGRKSLTACYICYCNKLRKESK